MIKRALLLLLLTAVWAFGSWWYYTCIIKGFCRADGTSTSATDQAKTIVATGTAAAIVTATELAGDEQVAQVPLSNDTAMPIATPPTTSEFVDQDNDAISDEDERRLGTNPASNDSDGDGLQDNEELGTDLQNPADTDKDGIIDALDDDDDNDTLPTAKEIVLGTDPRNADTDDDALDDAMEVGEGNIGTDPLKSDTDNDGISDGTEVGSDPGKPMDTDKDGIIDALDDDDDGDGIPTAIEIQVNSDPLNQDSDGDGISDGEELGDNSDQPRDSDGDGIIDLIDSAMEDSALATNATPEDLATENALLDSLLLAEANTSDTTDQTAMPEPSGEDTATVSQTDRPASDDGLAKKIPIQKSRLYFPSRSTSPGLSEAATNYFKSVAKWLNASPSHTVVLTGHTDDVGKAKNNLALGLKRAMGIKSIMVELGANESRIETASMGEAQPIASNKTDSGRRQNRRVELIPALKQ